VAELVLPTYGGVPCFGIAVHVQHIPNAACVQRDAYFGTNGTTSQWGGTRGRTFKIKGCLFGLDIPGLIAAETVLLAYGDGIGRILTDACGRVFYNVIFEGEYLPSPEGPKWTDTGVILPYECTFYGLS
jgi:hypothetical protein